MNNKTETCVVCGETEEANESHDLTPTDAHGFLPLSKICRLEPPLAELLGAAQQMLAALRDSHIVSEPITLAENRLDSAVARLAKEPQ